MSLGKHAMPFPARAERCPYCRLVIGAGRCKPEPEATESGARAHSSAAGMLASAARRADGDILDSELIAVALRDVAARRNCPLDRLRMLDYQEESQADPSLPVLADVLATFGGWKRARRSADAQMADAA
jgi:hypothetical protein